jgi:hypothetical protein
VGDQGSALNSEERFHWPCGNPGHKAGGILGAKSICIVHRNGADDNEGGGTEHQVATDVNCTNSNRLLLDKILSVFTELYVFLK